MLSIPHGIDKKFQCTKIVYDLVNPDKNEYIFGVNYTSLTEKQVNGEKAVQHTVTGVQSAINAANASASKAHQAGVNAENVIAKLPTEYVQTTVFESYKTTTDEQIKSLSDRITKLEGGTE